jgi:hypothetical protein
MLAHESDVGRSTDGEKDTMRNGVILLSAVVLGLGIAAAG